jgi:hypothetical protein
MNMTKIFSMTTPISHFKDLYEKYEVEWNEVNIFGIRNEELQMQDVFNDYIGVVTDNTFNCFTATTDPGAWWTKHGGANVDATGVAHLCTGNHKDAYIVGNHYNYEAMVQQGNTVSIWRDKNKNFINDDKCFESGFFGIDIHRASLYSVTDKIGKWSAGCQVIQSNTDFELFMALIKNSDTFGENEFAKFNYFLLDKEMFYL